MSPYGLEFVERPGDRLYVFNISNAMSYRVVHLDGRGHPAGQPPSYMGHSIGWWEGDTLVIDTVGFSETFWMNRDGLPHTDRMRLTERITRLDSNALRYEVTVDDPGAYTAPWTSGFNLRWAPGIELFEYQCQGNNFFPESVFGPGYFVDTVSIVP